MWIHIVLYLFFFFKQKTAYEMRISDWSSDVCSSDLHAHHHHVGELALFVRHVAQVLRGDPDLADDLGGGKVAVETLGGGGTELAVERAAHLRGHAQRAAPLVGDEHRFDGVVAVHAGQPLVGAVGGGRSEEHTSELQSLMRISYAVFCL